MASLTGISPDFLVNLLSHLRGLFESSSEGFITLPASKRPQVDAFTSRLSALFKCASQEPAESFSEIKMFLVLLSGILSNDSAKHIRATPSLFESPYSLRNASS